MSIKHLRLKDSDPRPHDDKPLPLWSKLCFAVGGAPYQITTNVIGFFLSIFLLEVAQIGPYYISIILFVGKAWDAVTDPACGYFVNKTETRFGKMKPWIILSAPFACISYFFLWYVPDLSETGKFGYYFAMYCIFQGLLSGLHVPYTSLTMYISNDQKERDSATSYRMVFEACGVLTGVIVQGKLIEEHRTAGECQDVATTVSPESLRLQEESYRVGSYIVLAIYMLCACTVFFGVKEKEGVVDTTGDSDGYFKSLKIVFTYKPYLKAAAIFLFMSLAVAKNGVSSSKNGHEKTVLVTPHLAGSEVQERGYKIVADIVQGNIALYCTHSLKMGKKFTNFIIVLLVVSITAMPLWQLLLVRFGKKTVYAAGILIFLPILIAQLYLPVDNEYLYYVIMGFAGLSISVSLLLPWSVLPDVLDLFMLETHTRKDAMFYSFYVFFNKLASGLGLALSQVALSVGGYVSGECVQPESVDLTLRLLVVPGPVVCLLLALIFLGCYPINEEKRKAIKQEVLDAMSKKEKAVTRDFTTSMSYESIHSHSEQSEF